ncbi:uncharacterized protein MYCFIDRAFT_88919 [Pseudocercospora fijiensis CIRAD86]|uniref:Uncharacterized protein n=1 Tax=Pseudocercospora fijiensis (strain CIRAD86) TaxID=383855 RepID=N1Q9H3_PSEFD|nr:uncharacterized protein MYCFIDRAFT_88919 [Pseudocercospora fijiensis CIRAD86]EME88446.1 hypothetical protein MYCFIDRAFT_88919 [Pseudocercospora fijiensis CIRAD86]
MHYFSASLVLAALAAELSNAQCINNVAAYNPNIRTMTANQTWFVVPAPNAAVQKAVDESNPTAGLKLLPVPNDQSLFPQGFPAGMHPVLVSNGRNDDIRMSALQIDGALMTADIYVPYVSKGGSQTPLSAALPNYIAGENGPLPNGLVPAVASNLLFAGNPLRLGQFIPESSPYQSDAGGTLSAAASWAIVPNPVSGPGVYPEAADFLFKTTSSPKYTAKGFKTMINLPIVLPSGLCQRNTYYFNNATALPVFRNGQVTLGPGASGTSPTSGVLQQASPDGSGVYENVDGYGACAQNVGNNPQDCETAAKTVDPASLQ